MRHVQRVLQKFARIAAARSKTESGERVYTERGGGAHIVRGRGRVDSGRVWRSKFKTRGRGGVRGGGGFVPPAFSDVLAYTGIVEQPKPT